MVLSITMAYQPATDLGRLLQDHLLNSLQQHFDLVAQVLAALMEWSPSASVGDDERGR